MQVEEHSRLRLGEKRGRWLRRKLDLHTKIKIDVDYFSDVN